MKHLFSSWAISLFALFIIVPNSFATKWKAEHVVLIGLDGWGAYSVEKADIPNTKSLMENGELYFKKRSTLPSSSAINWASMFMEQVRNCTVMTEWGLKLRNFPHAELNQHGIFPTIFQVLRVLLRKQRLLPVRWTALNIW